jgi:hypothetical protein
LGQIDICAKEFNTKSYYIFGDRTKHLLLGISFELFSFELFVRCLSKLTNQNKVRTFNPVYASKYARRV